MPIGASKLLLRGSLREGGGRCSRGHGVMPPRLRLGQGPWGLIPMLMGALKLL